MTNFAYIFVNIKNLDFVEKNEVEEFSLLYCLLCCVKNEPLVCNECICAIILQSSFYLI